MIGHASRVYDYYSEGGLVLLFKARKIFPVRLIGDVYEGLAERPEKDLSKFLASYKLLRGVCPPAR
jgi:hypothetical protein